MEETKLFSSNELKDANIKEELKSICENLEERGYNPIKQIVGYLISSDPGYISNYKESRNRITRLDINEIIEHMLINYLK